MGTYVSISIGDYDFISSKNSFGDLLLPFSPRNLKEEPAVYEDGDEYIRRYLSMPIGHLKLILDGLGYTIDSAKEDFSKLKKEKLEFVEYCLEDSDGNTYGLDFEDISKNFTFDNWRNVALRYAKKLYKNHRCLDKPQKKELTITERFVLESLPYGEGFWGFMDVEFNVWSIFRVLLDAFSEDEEIVLDYTELYESGWCEKFPSEQDYEAPKTIILTEGKFDAEVIEKSMNLLYPYMSKFYSFMNFSEYKVQGSTNFLTHYLKAFIASGIQNRVIALYDNDSAGLAELIDLKKFHAPDNFRIMHLPDIDLAKNYPTLGPNGAEELDINGKACSIELFLGRDVLLESGSFVPIHWKGYIEKTCTYQGEVMQKGLIQSRFLEKCKSINDYEEVSDDDINWLEMRILLNSLFNVFH